MNVTICCKRFGPSGGAEKFLGNFARCLVSEGHQVKVMAAEFTGQVQGVVTRELPVPPAPKPFRDLALAKTSLHALRDDEADVTFSDQKCWGADVVRPGGGVQRGYFAQWEKSFPSATGRLLWRLRNALSIRDRLRVYIDDRLYAPPGPRRVIANSNLVRKNLLHHYPHLTGRICVVYNGVDPRRFSLALRQKHRDRVRATLGIASEALVTVFVGTGWQRKGLYTCIRALGMLVHRNPPRPVRAIVAGKGPQRRAQRFARRHGVEETLDFVGLVDPRPYYGAADVLVHPSYFDPCANVTLEALACGLPVVTSAWNGASELLTPGENGFVVDEAGDARAVADYLARFLDRNFLAAASASARTLALNHTLDRMYRELMDAVLPVAKRQP